MAESRYWVEDILSGIVLTQDLPLNDVQVSDHLNRPGALRATLPKSSSFATEELIDENRRAIYWERDGKIEFGGILRVVNLGLGERTLSLEVEGWLGYWDHRDIWRDRTFTNTEQFEIVQTLIEDAQDEAYSTALGGPGADSDLGITVTWDAASGVLRDRVEDFRDHKAQNLGEAVRRLAGVGDGFDYSMVYGLSGDRITKAVKLYYPQRGRDTGYLFEFDRSDVSTAGTEDDSYEETYEDEFSEFTAGVTRTQRGRSNISRWGVNRDGSKMAWKARGWGSGYEADRLRSQQTTEAQRGVYPPLDVAFRDFASVEVQATLDEHTLAALGRTDHPTRVPLVEIDPTMFPKWGDWELGDTVLLQIDDGYGSIGRDVPVSVRIIGWSVNPKTDRPVLAFEET